MPQFEDAGGFSEGLAPVRAGDGTWGYIDTTGNRVITPQFDEAEAFTHGFAKVNVQKSDGTTPIAYIDKTGRIAINTHLDTHFFGIDDFAQGIGRVMYADGQDGQGRVINWGYVDSTGKYIWKPTN